jgi:hypothetical protein
MNPPQELLAQRQRDYREALDRQARAIEKHNAAVECVQQLERQLLEAEDEDRRALGEALVDNRKPPAGKTERARDALAKAKDELAALAYAAERAGQTLDRMPNERKRDWLREARRDFQSARADYEQQLGQLAEAHQRLADEAALVSFLSGQAVRMQNTVRVRTRGVEGLAHDVSVSDVLDALRDELTELELAALTRGREVAGATSSS